METALAAAAEAHAEALEDELRKQERDLLEWHADDVERRRPLNRLKAMIAALRRGRPVFQQQLIDWPRRDGSSPRADARDAPAPSVFDVLEAKVDVIKVLWGVTGLLCALCVLQGFLDVSAGAAVAAAAVALGAVGCLHSFLGPAGRRSDLSTVLWTCTVLVAVVCVREDK